MVFLNPGKRSRIFRFGNGAGGPCRHEVNDAIFREGLFDLEGFYGNKEGGDPVEYDHLRLVGTETETNMTVFNRGIALFFYE